MQYNTIYAGNPAKNISDKIGNSFKEKSIDEKINCFNLFIEEYKKEYKQDVVFGVVEKYHNSMDENTTYYNITNRTYTKRNTKSEIEFNKWLFKYKAKFIPA